jgi:hypothetical protein
VLEVDDLPLAESFYERPSLIASVHDLNESMDEEKPSFIASIVSLNGLIGLN